jgi:hypothetical protein
MTGEKKDAQQKTTSDLLHNENCFHYLRNLKIPNWVQSYLPMAEDLKNILGKDEHAYNPNFAYGDLYTYFFDYLEEHIEKIYDLNKYALHDHEERLRLYKEKKWDINLQGYLTEITEIGKRAGEEKLTPDEIAKLKIEALKKEQKALDNFIVSLYHNDNFILEHTFEKIKTLPSTQTPSSKNIEKRISLFVSDAGEKINVESQSPSEAGSAYGRFTAMISDEFMPQHTTSLATIRHYKSNVDGPIEYRIGTQGQRHQGKERVSPLFKRFLQIQESQAAPGKITHIYFNNLGRDRTDAEGLKEKALTEQLEALEVDHHNVAVITLPADKGLMHKDDYKKTPPEHPFQSVKDEFLHIALEDKKAQHDIKDFHISDHIRGKIFRKGGLHSPEIERQILEELLDKSFKAVGIEPGTQLSTAQRQAVWFHFIKSGLTNYIIDALQPVSINFSCKDAIDRGGVSSAYYNLIKSFEEGKTAMTREEFDRALHAAPTMVKGRGMNHHKLLIWNALDAYINQNYNDLKTKPMKAWVIEWRDANCPHHRVGELLDIRLQQCHDDLHQAIQADPGNSLVKEGLKIIAQIEEQRSLGVSGKRLLLEAATTTTAMALNTKAQTFQQIERYNQVIDKLSVKYPALNVLSGMMKAFVGAVVFLFTFGKKHDLMDSGLATMKSGFESEARKGLQKEMADMKSKLHVIKHYEDTDETPENSAPSNL